MRVIIFSMFICLILFNVNGEEISFRDLYNLNEKDFDTLSHKGEISGIIRENELPGLIPDIISKSRILEEIKEIDPIIGVEIIFRYKRTYNSSLDAKKSLVDLYNILQSISTLKGIEYYSASRKKMRIFYKDAYVIESPDNKTKVDDPYTDSIPAENELFAYLKDSSFGNYVCHVEYFFENNTFLMEMENLTQIWYLFVPLINPYKLKSYIIITPIGDEILFYGYSCLRTLNIFNMAEDRIDSLYNRITAIYNWFEQSYK